MTPPKRPEAEPAALLDDALVGPLVPVRDEDSHKGSHGTLVAVAGSLDYLGAGILVASAAVRAGAGLVCLAVPASLQSLIAGRPPEAISLGLPESNGEVETEGAAAAIAARRPRAVVMGPGLAAGEATARLVRAVLGDETQATVDAGEDVDARPTVAAVLDAGALISLASTRRWWEVLRRPCVLTPHPGEFARLDGSPVSADDDDRLDRARAAAGRWRQVVVLKGARTVVAAPNGRAAIAPFRNPALATAGTGDVLSGTVGAFLAQGLAPWDAARIGVYLHGVAAQQIRERLGDSGLAASDLPFEIALARHRLAHAAARTRRGSALGFGKRADA